MSTAKRLFFTLYNPGPQDFLRTNHLFVRLCTLVSRDFGVHLRNTPKQRCDVTKINSTHSIGRLPEYYHFVASQHCLVSLWRQTNIKISLVSGCLLCNLTQREINIMFNMQALIINMYISTYLDSIQSMTNKISEGNNNSIIRMKYHQK